MSSKRPPDNPEPDQLHDIFIETGYPEHNFVLRPKLIQALEDELESPKFSVITVIGPSRTGKTQLVKHLQRRMENMRPFIELDGAEIFSQRDLLYQLAAKITSEVFHLKLQDYLKQVFNNLEFNFGLVSLKTERNSNATELSDLLVAIRRALTELAKLKAVIIIDDCHKLPDDGMQLLLNFAKSLTDESNNFKGLKIVLIYIPTRHIRTTPPFAELGTRVKTISVPLWEITDLERIALGVLVRYGYGTVGLKQLAEQCFGLPSMMQLCCQIHFRKLPREKKIFDITIHTPVLRNVASQLWMQVAEAIYQPLVAKKTQLSSEIFVRADGLKTNINELIWSSISQMDLQVGGRHAIGLSIEELYEHMKAMQVSYFSSRKQIELADVIQCVEWMAIVVEDTYLEMTKDNKKKLDPVFELRDEEILIYSPDFLFALRHAEEHRKRLNQRN